jgi:ferredoxin
MTALKVITTDGTERAISGRDDATVMEVIRDNGIDEMLAICGGALSCATCHVYVADAWLSKLQPQTEDENELLDSVSSRQPNSRLSCQIILSAELADMTVVIAPD